MSTSWRCWKVWAWNSLRVESSLMDTQMPSPSQASWRTWLSLRGWASNDFCKGKREYVDMDECKRSAGETALLSGLSSKTCLVLWHWYDTDTKMKTESEKTATVCDIHTFKVSKVNLTSKGVLSLHAESQTCTCHSPCNRGSHLCIWSTKSSLRKMVFRSRILFYALISCAGTWFFYVGRCGGPIKSHQICPCIAP